MVLVRPRTGSRKILNDAMRLLILLTCAALFLAGPAAADPQTDALCRPIQGEWNSVASGTDLAAMDREIGKIPPLCAALKAQAQGRRAQVVRQQEQRQSALAARATHEKTNGQAIMGDDAAYDIAKASNVLGAYDAYLSRYPSGRHADEARRQRAALALDSASAAISPDQAQINGDNAMGGERYAEAMRWYREAADGGNAAAETEIGHLYQHGLGLPADYSEAMRWYLKAASQGNATAEDLIGDLYEEGDGVARDHSEARAWWTKAGDAGDPTALYSLEHHP
jgi:TPR repeat protein